MSYRMIQVGTGGFGAEWCQRFLPPNISDGLIDVVAAVDIDPAALKHARRHLDLPAERCYTDIERAFDEHPADFCTVVVPPAAHEAVVDLALEHDLHILSEKPIADTLEASVRITEKVKRAGKKMGVTMSSRFDQDKATLRHELRSGRHGFISYLVLRLTCNSRTFGSWGKFRHEIPDPLLVDGAIHHLDMLADLAGADCEVIYADSWNPRWGQYAGASQVLVTMRFENGCRAFYEGSKTNAVGLNDWGSEYIRAECELATLILDHRRIERFSYDPFGPWAAGREGTGVPVPLIQREKWAHAWLIEHFVDWLDGGEPMETNVEDNLRSVALTFAAIESSRTRRPINVRDLLRRTQEEVQVDHVSSARRYA
jgi:predicted dehydrogenase